ncbi:hypothetical protein HYR69_05055 [Candidatus Sumerlaeota bacterium]|nr:hypothetical protein [Candidatus Sumerlaeota bacterium]
MGYERATARYRNLYAKLLGFYPEPYRDHFGESMEQTFNDLCRERREAGKGLLGLAIWVFLETSAGILRENMISMTMQKNIFPIAAGAGLMLLIPLALTILGEGVSGEMNTWNLAGRIVVAAIPFDIFLAIYLSVRKLARPASRAGVGTGLILLVPFVLTLLGSGVDGVGWHWTPGDFIVMGTLLFGTGLAIDFAARKIPKPVHRISAIAAIVLAFLFVWAGMVANIFERSLEWLLKYVFGLP